MVRSSLIVLLLAFSASASAAEFDYSFFELGYGNIEFDDVDVDGDGFGLAGSFAISPDWHVFADYQAAGLDFGIDATTFGAGIGYNTGISPTVDLVASLGYEWVELDAPVIGDVDDSGFSLGVGLRFEASPEIELNAGITYVDFGDGGDDTGFSAGGYYSFSDAFSLGLNGTWSDISSGFTLSGRFYFDE